MKTSISHNNLFIEKMSVDIIIGAYGFEKQQTQPCEVSVVVEVESLNTIESDTLDSTYDYGQVVVLIRKLAEKSFQLVEVFAQTLAKELLQDQRLLSVEVTVSKLGAFVDVARAGCRIRFFRD